MKKLLYLFLVLGFLSSCDDDEDCDCGTVESTTPVVVNGTDWEYYISVRNECTGAIETNIQVTENIYTQYATNLGTTICNISGNRLN